jgi:predicted nucleotidyltransferase
MAIDWDHHFRRIESEIAQARRRAVRGAFADLPARERRASEARWIRTLAAMLASRHIPPEMRTASPAIPWRAIARLADYVDWCARTGMALPGSVIDDFNKDAAPAMVPALRELKGRLAMVDADGNDRSGILAVSARGGFAHVTVRVPADALPALRTCVARLYEGRAAPTLADVRARLMAASARLRHFGVTEVLVYGSVAAGCAAPASDVDLVYRVGERLDFERWARLCDVFEEVLDRVVDAHLLEEGTMPPSGAIIAWKHGPEVRRSTRMRTLPKRI